jgi:hypothetical protein
VYDDKQVADQQSQRAAYLQGHDDHVNTPLLIQAARIVRSVC